MAALDNLDRMSVITLVLLTISAISVTVVSLVPIYMRLLRHLPAVLRMYQGITSGFSITMMILAIWLNLDQTPCRVVLALELYFMTSSLTWFAVDNVDISMVTLDKPMTNLRHLGAVMLIGWGLGLIPTLAVLLSVPEELGLQDGMCWFGDSYHWALLGILLIGSLVELASVYAAMFVLLKKRREEPYLKILPEKKARLLSNMVTYTMWSVVKCVGYLSMTSDQYHVQYLYGAFAVTFAMLHGGLFVLGEYKISSRLSIVYRLLRLQNDSPSTRELCRVPPLTKQRPKLAAVYRQKEDSGVAEIKL